MIITLNKAKLVTRSMVPLTLDLDEISRNLNIDASEIYETTKNSLNFAEITEAIRKLQTLLDFQLTIEQFVKEDLELARVSNLRNQKYSSTIIPDTLRNLLKDVKLRVKFATTALSITKNTQSRLNSSDEETSATKTPTPFVHNIFKFTAPRQSKRHTSELSSIGETLQRHAEDIDNAVSLLNNEFKKTIVILRDSTNPSERERAINNMETTIRNNASIANSVLEKLTTFPEYQNTVDIIKSLKALTTSMIEKHQGMREIIQAHTLPSLINRVLDVIGQKFGPEMKRDFESIIQKLVIGQEGQRWTINADLSLQEYRSLNTLKNAFGQNSLDKILIRMKNGQINENQIKAFEERVDNIALRKPISFYLKLENTDFTPRRNFLNHRIQP